ncbi:GNAT family N-acetyltransferase [Virgibacillus halophilus]|uniref:GNAT family N-acetyltransferase n=1 Tax=Tigheibacillus halophilus TaxID=361280 RepID=A0ABU5C8P8_9BACI|nr:GNAT family N-acetyltransferase [Virgibacillus halophilus]
MNAGYVSIRNMEHTDYEIMGKWLSTKEVLEFYGDMNSPFTLEEVKRKYAPRVNGDIPVHPYIVELNSAPVGFMQRYKIDEDEKKEFGYASKLCVYGIDQFIGIPDLFNKGLGTIMVSKFIAYIRLHTDVDIIILDPDVSNMRAIKCYEKCGFKKVRKINKGLNWLMEWTNGRG